MLTGNPPTDVPQRELRPGYSVSRLIKGGWQLSGDHGSVDRSKAIQDMIRFVESGVTTFDCADIYTGVEELIGQFRQELSDQKGAEVAGQVKVHTKYVPDRDSLGRLKLADVETAIDRSLKRLGQERLDLVQFHWWDYDVDGHLETMAHLGRIRDKGKIDQIGVTNFDAEHLLALCAVTDITSAQVQYSLLDRRVEGAFAQAARQHNVAIFCYGTLAGGFLTDGWLGKPDPGFEFENRSLVKYRLIIEEFGGWDLFQRLLGALRRVADNHDTDIATLALFTNLDSPEVTAAIVGARYADRLPGILKAFEMEITDEDRLDLNAVLSQRKGPSGPVYELERDISGRHGRIMKYNLNKGDQDKFLEHDQMGGTS